MEYVIVMAVITGIMVLFGLLLFRSGLTHIETGEKRAGRQGEQVASQIIKEILNDEDILLTNVKTAFTGNTAELDNVIINNHGIFIIEVKNYTGMLAGNGNDKEWLKSISSGAFFQKSVKNPIWQVKRQVSILSDYLKQYGIKSKIEGYAFLLERNSPVESPFILSSQKDIDSVIYSEIDPRRR
ncbi:MAG: NERD domain-containing protein [Lachnospiraceae bacterium]|nr:NERD domain-containing protein [Lachnospiraceae bacterium]